MQQLYQTISNSHTLMLKITQWRNYSTNTMLSLNWILVVLLLTLAHLHYLEAMPRRKDRSVTWNHLKELNYTSCKDNSFLFHSPTNVEPNCTVSALNCTMRELENARSKCYDKKQQLQIVRKAEDIIKSLTKGFPASTDNATNCTPCDGYAKKPYKKFIEDLLVLINQQYTMEKEIQLRNVPDNL